MLNLQRRLTVGSWLDRLLIDLDSAIKTTPAGRFELNFTNLDFADPAGVVTLANACAFLRTKGFLPVARTPLPSGEAIRYLTDSRFFEFLANPDATDLTPGRSTTFPLTRVGNEQVFDLLANRFSPWLSRCLNISNASLEQLRMCLGELFNNISDHAGVSTGFFFAQHFPNEQRVRISLADFGVGIPTRVRRMAPLLDDAEALSKAFEEGFSTKTTPRNRGAGLDWLKRYVVETNGGAVRVYSHLGRLIALRRANGTNFRPTLGEGHFPGVLYYIVLRTDTIEPVEETREALEW
jgi:anti-sigma regulatory factor (Ser/Thr protein kinase)